MKAPLTVGVVNYINTSQIMVPWYRKGGPEGWNVLESTPTVLNRLLSSGDIAVGLVSSFAYGLEWKCYLLLPDLGISATGPVRSVLLIARRPMEELEKIVTTPHSATSVNLLRVIFHYFMGRSVEMEMGTYADFLSHGDSTGYLAIGDEALRLAGEEGFLKVDLAQLWLEETGLPFVFAVWAVRRDVWGRCRGDVIRLCRHIHVCRREGAAMLHEIARVVAPRIPMDRHRCLTYLAGIQLDLGPEKQRGMEEYFLMLYQMGLLSSLPRLQFAQTGG